MYNLYIYQVNRTILYTRITYKDCITNLLKHNVKRQYRMVQL